MSPEEVRQARRDLRLSRSQMAAILGTDTRHVRRLVAEARPKMMYLPLSAILTWFMHVGLDGSWPIHASAP